jgi:hypothetical protein
MHGLFREKTLKKRYMLQDDEGLPILTTIYSVEFSHDVSEKANKAGEVVSNCLLASFFRCQKNFLIKTVIQLSQIGTIIMLIDFDCIEFPGGI